MRALTSVQYANTIRDLFADSGQQPPLFVAEVGPALAEQQLQAAEQIARRASANLPKLMGCDPTAGTPCVRKFITDFGGRAFRRPLDAGEIALYEALYTKTRSATDDRTAAELVVEALIQSPFFLYRPELGTPTTAGEPSLALTPYELASRLSYLLTDTMPDAELMRSAQSGALAAAEDVAREARRLLQKPQAKAVVGRFNEQWFDFGRVEDLTKAPAAGYAPSLRPFMREETRLFLEYVTFQGTFADLASGAFTFANKPLATFYGVSGPAGAAFERVALDPTKRAGIATHASLMAVNAESNQTHPVLRGKLVRTRLLCEALPDTPPGLEIKIPEVKPGQSARQRWGQHSADAACAACHRLMDPIGFGFENYDAVGAYRDRDQGAPVDASGELVGSDVAGKFAGAIELSKKLAASQQARACIVTQWFRFAFSRLETPEDACTLATLTDLFSRSGGKTLDMLIAMTASPAFMSRRPGR